MPLSTTTKAARGSRPSRGQARHRRWIREHGDADSIGPVQEASTLEDMKGLPVRAGLQG